MLTLCCTKKILDETKQNPCDITEQNPLFTWYANLLTLHRRKAVLLLNEYSRYPILIYGLKAADFKRLDQIIEEAVEAVFLALGISKDIVEKYELQAAPIAFTKTSDRSVISAMNQVAQMLSFCNANEFDVENPVQTNLSLRYGEFITKINGNYKKPTELLLEAMAQFSDGKTLETKPAPAATAYQFLITLALEGHDVWRRVIVPADISFRKLHYAIQDAFGWKSYHLYEFGIVNGRKLVAQVVCDAEGLEYAEVPASLDNKTKLSKYLPKYRQMGYIYDMGDNWEHIVELEKIIDNYDRKYPVCIDGKGSCPPEDVGGEGGYEEFLKAIGDPKNPEHEEMLEWGKSQGYCEFDIDEVNQNLKSSLKRRT